MRIACYLLSLLAVTSLVACSQSSRGTLSTCSTDIYMAKYNCSFTQIQTAAKAGDSDAQYALGYMYYYGINTPRDLDAAKVWIGRSAEQGQVLAKQALTVMGTTPPPVVVTKPPQVQDHHQPVIAALQRQPVYSSPPAVSVRQVTTAISMGYTLQLMGTHDLNEINRLIKAYHLQGRATYYIVNFHHAKWYTLIYGNYQTSAEAHVAASMLTREIPGLKPWVKPNREVKAEIAAERVL